MNLRHAIFIAAALSLAACQPARTLTHVAGIDQAYPQLIVGEEEGDLHVIDGDVLLRIDLDQAQLDRYTTGDDTVRLIDLDERDLARGRRVLLHDRQGLWRIADKAELLISGPRSTLRAAAWRDAGLVTLEQRAQAGCVLVWHDAELLAEATLEMAERACADGAQLRVDRKTDDAFVVTLDGVWAARLSGEVTTWAEGGNLARFDPAIGALVVATRRDTELHAWNMDGEELWWADLGEPVIDFDDLGAGGALAVITASGEGGRLALLDSLAGQPLTAESLPSPPVRVHGGEGGGRIVLSLKDEMHVFDVNLGAK